MKCTYFREFWKFFDNCPKVNIRNTLNLWIIRKKIIFSANLFFKSIKSLVNIVSLEKINDVTFFGLHVFLFRTTKIFTKEKPVNNVNIFLKNEPDIIGTHPASTCSKLAIETLEKGVKYVQN